MKEASFDRLKQYKEKDDFDDNLLETLSKCDVFILLISNLYLQSKCFAKVSAFISSFSLN